MEPASTIITLLGGTSKVAEITGAHRSRVWRWTRPKNAGGTGGRVPQNYHRALLDAATSAGKKLRAEDFLPLAIPAEQVAA